MVQAGNPKDVAGSSDHSCRLGKPLLLPAAEMTRMRFVDKLVGALQDSAAKPALLPFSLMKRGPCRRTSHRCWSDRGCSAKPRR